MTIDEYCRKFKVSRSQAEHEHREREKHEVDIAQPGSPLFEKVWKPKIQKDEAVREEQRSQAKEAWLKREWEKGGGRNRNGRKYFI